MTDVFDSAQARAELDLEASLSAARGNGSNLEAAPTGDCLYCFDSISVESVNKRFCDASCRDSFDYGKRHTRRRN